MLIAMSVNFRCERAAPGRSGQRRRIQLRGRIHSFWPLIRDADNADIWSGLMLCIPRTSSGKPVEFPPKPASAKAVYPCVLRGITVVVLRLRRCTARRESYGSGVAGAVALCAGFQVWAQLCVSVSWRLQYSSSVSAV